MKTVYIITDDERGEILGITQDKDIAKKLRYYLENDLIMIEQFKVDSGETVAREIINDFGG
jgi:hypothetical protein